MADTLFKEVLCSLSGLSAGLSLGRIKLPDVQRRFFWANAKVRDLFASIHRGHAKLESSASQ